MKPSARFIIIYLMAMLSCSEDTKTFEKLIDGNVNNKGGNKSQQVDSVKISCESDLYVVFSIDSDYIDYSNRLIFKDWDNDGTRFYLNTQKDTLSYTYYCNNQSFDFEAASAVLSRILLYPIENVTLPATRINLGMFTGVMAEVKKTEGYLLFFMAKTQLIVWNCWPSVTPA